MAKCFLCGAESAGATCASCQKAGQKASPKRSLQDVFGKPGGKKPATPRPADPPAPLAEVRLPVADAAPVVAPVETPVVSIEPAPAPSLPSDAVARLAAIFDVPGAEPDEPTGFEADTTEVEGPARAADVLVVTPVSAPIAPPARAAEPRTDEIPLEVVSVPGGSEDRTLAASEIPELSAKTDPILDATQRGEPAPKSDPLPVLLEPEVLDLTGVEATPATPPAPAEFAESQAASSVGDVVGAADDEEPSEHKKIERWNSILDESPVFAGQGDFEVQTPCAPAPGSLDVAIGVRFDVMSAPAETEPVVHMLVTMQPYGAPLMAGRDGPVAHVILALDLSASMNKPDKYPLLTRALSNMLRELRSKWAHEVLVSVVAFAYGSETLVRAMPSSQIDEREVLRRLDTWEKRFTRYTDLTGALGLAGRIARDSVAANKAMPVRIYVLTDGKPQDMKGSREVMQKVAKLPVDVNGLAFGEDADVESLSQLFSGGRGATVKHIRADTIGEAFGRIGEVAHLVVANRALLDVELRGGVIGGDAFRYRPARHRYPKGSFERGVHFATDLGTLESGRTYSMLFQLRLRRTKGQETEIGRVALRVPGFGGPRTFEKLVCIQRHPGTTTMEPDPEVQAALDVVTALDGENPEATLRALKIRRGIYANERRDPHVLFVIDKAILELEQHGSLAGLTASEHATLVSHTLTTRVRRGELPREIQAKIDAAVAARAVGAAPKPEAVAAGAVEG